MQRPHMAGVLAGPVLGLLVLISCAEQPHGEAEFVEARNQMVQRQIAARGVTNAAVLAAMRSVPREVYVPDGNQSNAFADSPLPIGAGQTISQPYIVAAMTEALDLAPGSVVLEVGTGSGYQAAVLGELAAQVYTIEIVDSLAHAAALRLAEQGYTNITVRAGDGYGGWPEHAPYDGIMVTAAPDHIPQPLIDQLKPGGRMIIPVGEIGTTQELILVEKTSDGAVHRRTVMLVRFVPFTRR